jgi:hypothetical protein
MRERWKTGYAPALGFLLVADVAPTQGLITGRTSMLCLDPEQVDMTTKKLVASVTCHEVAHQWFGNITTMEWWDKLYLVRFIPFVGMHG